jgi:hypothetical protein
MIYDKNYEPTTLLAPFEQGPVVPSFLRDTFFTGREYPPTNLIEFDFRRGRRKMAPFVAPLVGGKVMEREGYETRFFRAPRIAPVRNLRIPDLEPRMFGETIYSGKTPADRAADLLAEDAVYCDEAIARREEWMCREVLVNGVLTITADHGYTMVIDFMESSAGATDNHQPPANGTWDNAASTPLTDLESARLEVIKLSGVSPNVVLMGTDAASAFVNNAQVAKFLDNTRFQWLTVAPIIQSQAVVRIGRVPGMEIYQYSEYFEDDLGVLFPMIPPEFVMLLSTEVTNKIVYGAFTQLEDAKNKRYVTYQTSRIPFVYGDEVDGHLFYRLTSCPLPMPTDTLGWRIIDALPPGLARGGEEVGDDQAEEGQVAGRTVEGRPYFAPTNETAHEKNQPELAAELREKLGQKAPLKERGEAGEEGGRLEDHTVEELRAIAEREGAEGVDSRSTKADIVKAIKKHRKGGNK